jgi:hypothetical protein
MIDNEQTNINPKERLFDVRVALAMSASIYRQKGYTSTSTYISSDPAGEIRWTNKDHLIYQLVPSLASSSYISLFKVTQADYDTADAIIKYYRKLSFGVLGGELNDYMQKVFSTTQNDKISFSDLGILASVPSVYEREVKTKELESIAKGTKQEYLGKEGDTLTLTIKYINTRFVPALNCFAHDAVTDTNHLVNFLNKLELGKPGETQKIKCRVKKHGLNFTTKTMETQLNYVKIVDNVFVWQ